MRILGLNSILAEKGTGTLAVLFLDLMQEADYLPEEISEVISKMQEYSKDNELCLDDLRGKYEQG